MTRKDYALIAQTFADAMHAFESDNVNQTEFMRDWLCAQRSATKMLAETMAQRIARHNPTFKPATFLEACKVS